MSLRPGIEPGPGQPPGDAPSLFGMVRRMVGCLYSVANHHSCTSHILTTDRTRRSWGDCFIPHTHSSLLHSNCPSYSSHSIDLPHYIRDPFTIQKQVISSLISLTLYSGPLYYLKTNSISHFLYINNSPCFIC